MPGGGDIDFEGGATPYRFGAVTKEATGVELQPSDGSDPVPGTLVPLPPSLMNFPFDLFFLDAGALNGEIVATGLATPTASDPTTDPTPSSSPDVAASVGPTPQPGVNTIDGRGFGLHWSAASSVDGGQACTYLTIDDIPESDEICGDPSLPNIAFHEVDGGGFLFGAIPRLYQVEWSIEGGMTSGSVMFATSGFENGELIPFVTPVRATEGELRVQFLDDEGVVVYDWATDLAPGVSPTSSP